MGLAWSPAIWTGCSKGWVGDRDKPLTPDPDACKRSHMFL